MKHVKDSRIRQYLEVRDKEWGHHRGGVASFTTSLTTENNYRIDKMWTVSLSILWIVLGLSNHCGHLLLSLTSNWECSLLRDFWDESTLRPE